MADNASSHPQSTALRDRMLTLLRDTFRSIEREQLYRAAEAAMRFGRTGGPPPAKASPPFADAQATQRAFEAEFIHAIADARPPFSAEQVNLLVGDLVQQFEVMRRSEVARSSGRMAAMTAAQSSPSAGSGHSVLDDQRGPSLRSTPTRLRRDSSSGSIPSLAEPPLERPGSSSGTYTVAQPPTVRQSVPSSSMPAIVQGRPTVRQSMPSASMPAIVQGRPTVRQSMPSGSMPGIGGSSPARSPLHPPTRPLTGLPPQPAAAPADPTESGGITEGLGAVVLYDEKAGAIEVLPMSQNAEARVKAALGPGRQLRLLLQPAPAPGRDIELRVEAPWQTVPFTVVAKSGPSSPRGTLLEVSKAPQTATPTAAPSAPSAASLTRPVAAMRDSTPKVTPPAPGSAPAHGTTRLAAFDPKRPRPATGSLLAEADGTVGTGGPLGTLMQHATVHPGVVIEFEGPAEQWRISTLEDLLLDIEVEPMRLEFTLEALVTKSGLADAAKLQEAVAQHRRTGEPLETLLTTTGALRFRELDAILATRLRMLFAALATASPVKFRMQAFDRVEPLAVGQPISFATLAFGRIHDSVDKLPAGELEEWGRGVSGFPKTRRELRIPLQRFGIAARELAFLESEVNGATSVGALLSKSPVRRHTTLALLAALDRMGYLEWVRHEVSELRAMRAKPLIDRKVSELQQADLFGILDTHWSDYDKVIPGAAKRVIEALDLPYLVENGPEEMQATARRLAMALRAVADRLSTRQQREAVRAKLVDDFARSGAVDLYEKQADMAIFKHDWDHAEDQLRRIVELEPGNRRAAKRLEEVLAEKQG